MALTADFLAEPMNGGEVTRQDANGGGNICRNGWNTEGQQGGKRQHRAPASYAVKQPGAKARGEATEHEVEANARVERGDWHGSMLGESHVVASSGEVG